ncbi:hypothetical protein NEOLEDRAFT_1022935, partial [Neolentinus lepideus HHB14362 ss-1]
SFFLNSGATAHISPKHSDFCKLHPVPPSAIKGIGGSTIQVISVGKIKLLIVRGVHLT